MDLITNLTGYEYWVYRSTDGGPWSIVSIVLPDPSHPISHYHDEIEVGTGETYRYRVTIVRRIGSSTFETLGMLKDGRVNRVPVFDTQRTSRFVLEEDSDFLNLTSPYRSVASVTDGSGVPVAFTATAPSTINFESTLPTGQVLLITWTPEPGVIISFNQVPAWYLLQSGSVIEGTVEAENFITAESQAAPLSDSADLDVRAIIHGGMLHGSEAFSLSGSDWIMQSGENMASEHLARFHCGTPESIIISIRSESDPDYGALAADRDMVLSYGVTDYTINVDPDHPYDTLTGDSEREYWIRKLHGTLHWLFRSKGIPASVELDGTEDIIITPNSAWGPAISFDAGADPGPFDVATSSEAITDTDLSSKGEWNTNGGAHDGHNHVHIAYDLSGVDGGEVSCAFLICTELRTVSRIDDVSVVPLPGAGGLGVLHMELRVYFSDGSAKGFQFAKRACPFRRVRYINDIVLVEPTPSLYKAPQSSGFSDLEASKVEYWGWINHVKTDEWVPVPTTARLQLITPEVETISTTDVSLSDYGYFRFEEDPPEQDVIGYRLSLLDAYDNETVVAISTMELDTTEHPVIRLSGSSPSEQDVSYQIEPGVMTEVGGSRCPYGPGATQSNEDQDQSAPSSIRRITLIESDGDPYVLVTPSISDSTEENMLEVSANTSVRKQTGLKSIDIKELSGGVIWNDLTQSKGIGESLYAQGGSTNGIVLWTPSGGEIDILNRATGSIGSLYRDDPITRGACAPIDRLPWNQRTKLKIHSLPLDPPDAWIQSSGYMGGVAYRFKVEPHIISPFEDWRMIERRVDSLTWRVTPLPVVVGSIILVKSIQNPSGWVQIFSGETQIASGPITGEYTRLTVTSTASGTLRLVANRPRTLESIEWFGPTLEIGEPEVLFMLDGEPYFDFEGFEEKEDNCEWKMDCNVPGVTDFYVHILKDGVVIATYESGAGGHGEGEWVDLHELVDYLLVESNPHVPISSSLEKGIVTATFEVDDYYRYAFDSEYEGEQTMNISYSVRNTYTPINRNALIKADSFPEGTLEAKVRLRYQHDSIPRGVCLSVPGGATPSGRLWTLSNNTVSYVTRDNNMLVRVS